MGLEYRYFGEGKEVFVLENGIGRSMYEWYPVAKELAKAGRVLLYHRAGYGKSTCSKKERTAGCIAAELKELLDQLDIHQPVILVGDGFGGLCVQQFARMYKEMVKSIIVMDSLTASLNCSGMEELNKYSSTESQWILRNLNEQEQKDYNEFLTNLSRYETIERERKMPDGLENSLNEGENESFPAVAINVMVHDKEAGRAYRMQRGCTEEQAAEAEDKWFQDQLAIASQSPYGRLIYAENAGLDLKRDAFDLVVQTIKKETVRNPKEAISYCGINCYICPIFLATVTADDEKKESLAKEYSTNSMIFSKEDICCDGCGTRRSSYSKMCGGCQIKACAISKLSDPKNEICADCGQYPCTLIHTYVLKDNAACPTD